jgi:hypothetical protein
VLDTRASGPVGAGAPIDVQVTGVGGVPPSGVSAVVLNVTATQPTAASWLLNYPTGSSPSNTAALTYGAAKTVSNLVVAKVGTNGKTTFANANGSVQLIADVEGWYSDGTAPAQAGGLYSSLAPAQVLDTRSGSPVSAGQPLDVQVTGVGGVPSTGVSSVVLSVTATQPTAASWLLAYPAGTAPANTAALTYSAGQTVSNLVIAKLSPDGKVTFNNPNGSVHLIADVYGWYADASGAASATGRYGALSPARVIDTRSSGALTAGSATYFQVTGAGGVPANASAVVLNVTATNPTAASWLLAYPTGTTPANTAALTYGAGQTVSELVVAKLSPDGKVTLMNAVGSVNVIADVEGWYS